MPDLSTAPPTLGSKGKLQSQRGGSGRFNPGLRGGGRGGGRQGGRSGGSNSGPAALNPQHPGHIPGSLASRPLNGVFAIDKPSGKTCMALLESLKDLFAFSPLFRNPDGTLPEGNGGHAWRPVGGKRFFKGKAAPPKVGQGGTLDPLASGVLVIGVGSGTKRLQSYLDCEKTYEATGLLGAATTSYDSQDPVMTRAPHAHVTEEMVRSLLPYFTGPLLQYPPIYSAVKMDGKRLFDYARQGLQLPRPIEAREIEILSIECYDWLKGGEHGFKAPEKEVTEEEKALLCRVKEIVDESIAAEATGAATEQKPSSFSTTAVTEASSSPSPLAPSSISTSVAIPTPTPASTPSETESCPSPSPPAFKIRMTVSSGTYVRTIVHDVGQACNSAAHVVELRRVRQGQWSVPWSTSAPPRQIEVTNLSREKEEGCEENQETTRTERTGERQQETPLPCLPWSLFLSALEEQKAQADPNARNFALARRNVQPKETEEERKQEEGKQQEEGGGKEKEEPVLKEWEKELLRVLQPC